MQRKDERFTQPVEGYLNIDVPVDGERFPCVLLQRAQDWRCTGDKGKDRWAVLSQQPGGYGGGTRPFRHELQPRGASGRVGHRAPLAPGADPPPPPHPESPPPTPAQPTPFPRATTPPCDQPA